MLKHRTDAKLIGYALQMLVASPHHDARTQARGR
jgi:hypothetical protein